MCTTEIWRLHAFRVLQKFPMQEISSNSSGGESTWKCIAHEPQISWP